MSTAEYVIRLILAAVFALGGIATLWPKATRRQQLAACVVLVVGTTAIAVFVDWPARGGRP